MTSFVRRMGTTMVAAACVAAGATLVAQQTSSPPAQQTPPQTPPAQQTPQGQPVFRAGVNLITVDAYPQRDGKIVPDLKASDFEVYEDGKLQKVETFNFVRVEPDPTVGARKDPNTVAESIALAADPANRVFVAYLDLYHVTVAGSHDIRKPLADVFAQLMSPNDLFGIMTPLLRPQDLALGRVSTGVEEQLTKYWPWGQRDSIIRGPEDSLLEQCFSQNPYTGQQWIVNDGASQRLLSDLLIDRRREVATIDSVEAMMKYLGSIREARKSILLISPGWVLYQRDDALLGQITTMPLASQPAFQACMQAAQSLLFIDDQQRMRELLDLANRDNVTFYPVSPSGLNVFDTPINQTLGANPNPSPLGPQSVTLQELNRSRARTDTDRTLAENTDGLAVVDTNDLRDGLKRVMEDQSAYYLLGYYSTNTKTDGKYRKLQVKVKQSGITMKARRGYVAPTAEASAAAAAAAAAAPAGPSLADTALSSLKNLDKAPDVVTYGAASATDLTVVVELSSGAVGHQTWSQGADVQATFTDAAGAAIGTVKGRIDAGFRSVKLQTPVGFGAGPWKVFVHATGRDDSHDERFQIAPSAGTLLGDPLYFRGTSAAQASLRPVADLEFSRIERLHIEWPIVSALDQHTARLLDRRGQPLPIEVTLTERQGPNGSVLAADLNLAPLAAGDYIIDLNVGHGNDAEHKLIAFRVIQ